MTFLPRKKKRPKMNVRPPSVIRCAGHLKFVRGFACAIFGRLGHECEGKTEAAHVRIGTDGGIGQKPSDKFVIPLCSGAHAEQHRIGEKSFEDKYRFSMLETAATFWKLSKHGREYEANLIKDRTMAG